ncbi:transglutaminase domain-containing protein [Geothrix terrae]|uniref:transglutaminase domain-containing protein n=1 Tax=Geothrix terrae TaxID=2922720 RepID=UPI001FABF045|nr:transglutaminase domain-containing protein [Geothrix terrae]
MCLATSSVRSSSQWNWEGSEIVNDCIIERGRQIPGTSREYPVDIREYLSLPRNAVLRKAIADLVHGLPPKKQDLLSSVSPGTYDERVRQALGYLMTRVKYKKGKSRGYDTWMYPDETLANGGGDCEDLAFLLASFLLAMGISGYVIRVALGEVRDLAKPNKAPHDHAWVMYKSEAGLWLLLDPLLHTVQAVDVRTQQRAVNDLNAGPKGSTALEYVPHFVFNDAHLWKVYQSGLEGGLRDYISNRRFWTRFDPAFGVQAHNDIFDSALHSMFSEAELAFIKATSLAVDANFLGYDSRDHFDNAFVQESWARIADRLSTGSLHDFALAGHGIGDFYAHTSYGHFAIKGGSIPPFDNGKFGQDPAKALSGPPAYMEKPFDLRRAEFSVNPAIWKGTKDQAVARWAGQIISGRFAQNGDPKQGWLDAERFTYIPKVLRDRPDYPDRGALPHHDEIAVDNSTPKKSHVLYPPDVYKVQFNARVAAATAHLGRIASDWVKRFPR